ncbi:hypothetical protein BDV93DRAFT_510221 [Ceratobasidium sp. AG-I]|nr:hypothetical protein BDV93DRAFT_510221 [Ceratobasidium sp. AG-I]
MSTTSNSKLDCLVDNLIRTPLHVSNITMANILAHLGLTSDNTQWLFIRCLISASPGNSKTRFKWGTYILWFANNWAAKLVVQDIFHHRQMHLLKLECKNKNTAMASAPSTKPPGSDAVLCI